ncbi:hypothetical protein ElyMa_002175000 [Elysia marginata]|uniref:Uncharacterized protein n=1 Tax=Elysia marginata TaxID=1093978 RepID=A0AAV4FNM9_9GAST|nr:hypothetical protein ElyMa_002175000 [Elysia marginata]
MRLTSTATLLDLLNFAMEENKTSSTEKSRKEGLREAVRNGAKTTLCRLLEDSDKDRNSPNTLDLHLDDTFRSLLMADAIDKGMCAVVEMLVSFLHSMNNILPLTIKVQHLSYGFHYGYCTLIVRGSIVASISRYKQL